MGVLQIECYCSETQMQRIISLVTEHIYGSDRGEIWDFDDVIDGVRVCVGFDTMLDKVSIQVSEILNSDWEVLFEDTAVFVSRLSKIVDQYNRDEKEAYLQAIEILNDQRYEA